MSIRLRLTLLYSAILALTLIVLGGALYRVVADVTFRAAQDQLEASANSMVALAHNRLDLLLGSLENGMQIGSVQDTSIQVRLFGPNGLIAKSPDLQASNQTLPLDTAMLQELQNGVQPVPSIVSVGGQQMLLYDILLTFRGAPIGVLQVARPMQVVDQPLDTVRHVLLIAGTLATLLAFGVGWLLAGAALRPINRITETAQEIGAAQDFDRRVDYAGPPDEVGRLAGTFNTMLARLQAAYHTQRRFVADASHELRTPLTSIRGNLGLLQREPPIAEEDRVAVLADLVSESERLSRLVSDLLTLARSDAGRALRHEPVPLAPLLADLTRRLAAAYPQRTILVESGADAAVVGDPDALTQVLLILLDNALKFTPADGTVGVSTAIDDGHVAIAVRDTGHGIAPDALPHIFERFYQGDAARAGTGAGLGLAIAKALVEGQGGTIDVESRLGAGSTFTVTLPRARMPIPVEDGDQRAVPSPDSRLTV